MKESYVKNVFLNLFAYRDHIFGEGSTYHGFEPKTPDQSGTQNHADSFNSKQLYGKILYKTHDDGAVLKSEPVMLKLSPTVNPTRWILYCFMNEIIFFTKILPLLNTPDNSLRDLFPKFYHGEIIFDVEHDHSAIILEDLTFRGYRMAEKKSLLDYQHLVLMMRKLGQFHAHSYQAKNTAPHLFYPLIKNRAETNSIVNGTEWFDSYAMRRGLQHLRRDSAYSAYIPKVTEMAHNCNNILKQIFTEGSDNPMSVIIHGDYLRNNVMFKYKNNTPEDLIIVDMATYRYASPVIDLATVMYMHANQEMRNEHWDDLIDVYCTSMKETFPHSDYIPSKDEILSEFVYKSFHGYLVASCFLPYLISYDNDKHSESFQDCCSSSDEDSAHSEAASASIDLEKELIPVDQTLGDILRDLIDRGFIEK